VLGHTPPPWWLASFSGECRKKLAGFNLQDLSNTLHAMAVLSLLHDPVVPALWAALQANVASPSWRERDKKPFQ
jgi:hypothetical protein